MAEITRKQFIKLLVAAGGATALAGFLPGKWIRPIVKVGVLPVHAQASGLTISNLSIYSNRGQAPRTRGLASPVKYQYNEAGTCDFNDILAEMDETALIYLTATLDASSTVLIDWQVLSTIGSINTVDGNTGSLFFQFYLPDAYIDMRTKFYLTVKMNGRTAGPIEGSIVPT